MPPRVTQLNVYPVKGCKGISCATAAVLPTGLPYDRHWMIVRADNNRFITARQIPKLLLVSTALPPEALLGADWGQLQPGAALVLSAPGMSSPLQVPLRDPAGGVTAADIRRVTVWEWSGAAADEGDEAAAWLSEYLGQPVRLVRNIGGQVPDSVRPVDPEFAPSQTVTFADGYPLLVALEENLADLNARLAGSSSSKQQQEGLSMRRFRPNIVLAGAGSPWVDDLWATISVAPPADAAAAAAGAGAGAAGAVLKYVKPCDRCKVTTIDPDTAEVGDEPLKILGQFRSGKQLGWAAQRKSWTHSVFFAWNAVVQQQGRISVGDAVTAAQTLAAA